MRPHAEWKVMIQIARATGPSWRSTRSFISCAALFVKVIARISFGCTPTAASRCATRYVRTRVLPEPAPAITSSGPSVVSTASRWVGFKSVRYVSGRTTAISRGEPSADAAELRLEPRFRRSERSRVRGLEHDLDLRAGRLEA